MEYRVEELAAQAGISVDTIRFYQGRGLLPPPERRGRVAIYGDVHLERLSRIRSLAEGGLSLAVIRRLLQGQESGELTHDDTSLVAALASERVGERTLTRAELAAESGVAEPLVAAAEAAGLLTPLRVGGEARYAEADLAMSRAGLAILSAGFPLNELLALAVEHASHIQGLAERAIDLFDDHIRRAATPSDEPEAVTDAFRRLLPQVTRLVALHFQRTVVTRALARLEGRRELEDLAEALAAVESSRLEVRWS